MGFNFIEILSKWNDFQSLLKQSKQNPTELLESELKRRGINQQQLNELIQQAKSLSYLFKTK